MRLACALALLAGCAPKPEAAPSVPTAPDGVEVEVRELIARRRAEVLAHPFDGPAHGKLALAFEANGLWAQAAASFESAFRLDPKQPLWLAHAAYARRRAGDPLGALALLRAQAENAPQCAPLQLQLGEVLLQVGELEPARQAFERAMTFAPTQPEGFLGAAEIARRGGDDAQADALLEAARKLDPSLPVIGRKFNATVPLPPEKAPAVAVSALAPPQRRVHDDLDEELERAIVSPRALIVRGRALVAAGDLEKANGVLETLLARHPDDRAGLLARGETLQRLGRFEEAVGALQRAAALGEESAELHARLAACQLELGRADEARAEAQRAVELAPESGVAHQVRGRVLARAGEREAALDDFARAARLAPQDAEIRRDLGRALAGERRWPEALEELRAAAQGLPRDASVQLELARVCLALERREEATHALDAAKALAPKDPGVLELAAQLEKSAK